jgi:hypothetical protein
MLKENHLRIIREGLSAIQWAIDQGIEDKQTTIGFNTSVIAVNLLEIYPHQKNLIKVDYSLKHEWFGARNKIREKLNFDFEHKQRILELMFALEERRNILCYGKKQKIETINLTLEKFYELQHLLKEQGVNLETH